MEFKGKPEEVKEQLKNKRSLVAAFSYLIFFLPRLTEYKGDEDMRFHMKQGLGLLIAALSLQGTISVLGFWGMPSWRVWPVRLILFYWLFVGIRSALAGKKDLLPWIGKYADRAF